MEVLFISEVLLHYLGKYNLQEHPMCSNDSSNPQETTTAKTLQLGTETWFYFYKKPKKPTSTFSSPSQLGWEWKPLSGLAQPVASLTLSTAFIHSRETEEVEQSLVLLPQAQDFTRNRVFSHSAYHNNSNNSLAR